VWPPRVRPDLCPAVDLRAAPACHPAHQPAPCPPADSACGPPGTWWHPPASSRTHGQARVQPGPPGQGLSPAWASRCPPCHHAGLLPCHPCFRALSLENPHWTRSPATFPYLQCLSSLFLVGPDKMVQSKMQGSAEPKPAPEAAFGLGDLDNMVQLDVQRGPGHSVQV